MKMYRDWRISGDTEWLKKMYPKVVESMNYSIRTCDPRSTGTLEEPHHNTYDIEFWGPDGMCTSFYLGDWIGEVCGLKNIVDSAKVASHLNSVFKYNYRKDLTDHSNPQKPSYALGNEGGLLLCTWPKGGKLSLPFVYCNEYECGHWYARAMSSYGMLQGLTGVRYDAIDQVMYIDSRIGDFTSFLSTNSGFGNVGLKNGKPFLNVVYGDITVKNFIIR
jgi:hypothetical protein